jgi:hypothetical protein
VIDAVGYSTVRYCRRLITSRNLPVTLQYSTVDGTDDASGLAYNSKYNNYLIDKFCNLIQLCPF